MNEIKYLVRFTKSHQNITFFSLVLILNDMDKLDKSFLLTYMCDHLSDEYNICLLTISGFQFQLYLPKAINESRTLYNQFFHHYYSSLHKGKTIHEDTQKIALICKANINLYSVSHVPIEYWKSKFTTISRTILHW